MLFDRSYALIPAVFLKADLSLLRSGMGEFTEVLYSRFLSLPPRQLPTPSITDSANPQLRYSLALLPTDVLLIVLQRLDVYSIGRIACTCKKLRNLTLREDMWREVPVTAPIVQLRVPRHVDGTLYQKGERVVLHRTTVRDHKVGTCRIVFCV